jgi:hypothetical protein
LTAAVAITPKRLNIGEKQAVKYAIPEWLRNEQIKIAISKISGRIQPLFDRNEEPIAVVGYGPSLADTWEQIRGFSRIVSCSGSHKFLIERGIIPTYHVEVDPRSHKIGLLGTPNPAVEYLVSSTCHPEYFDYLKGMNVKLWHVFDASDDGLRLLPPGEWAITGGCDVGLRAMSLTAFLGFSNIHVFGLDGSARGETRHADTHPNSKQKFCEVEYPEGSGQLFLTTPAMLEAARQTVHEMKQMPSVKFTFYGEGLTQAIVKDYTPQKEIPAKMMSDIVGYSKPELISTEYADLNKQLHETNLAYGVGGGKHADTVIRIAKKMETSSILDYGCGKGYLAKAIPFPIWEYDPAVPGKEESPRPADLVVSTDVLEHIEPERLGAVLGDLRRVTKRIGYFTIHTGPAQKTLADGRNAHLIQQDMAWWKHKLKKFFSVASIQQKGPELYVIVAPKQKPAK